MKPGIYFKKIWFDDDVVELKLIRSTATRSFPTKCMLGIKA
jgi:hypothetical protein